MRIVTTMYRVHRVRKPCQHILLSLYLKTAPKPSPEVYLHRFHLRLSHLVVSPKRNLVGAGTWMNGCAVIVVRLYLLGEATTIRASKSTANTP